MKKKQKVDIGISLSLIFISIIILILPLFNFNNVSFLTFILYLLYTIIGTIKFFLIKDSKDYEGLHIVLSSILPLIITVIIKPETPRQIALILGIWLILMSITKLKKIDYYHDRHDRMWKVRTFILGLFILTGILSSVNLAFANEFQIVIFGFLTLIHGILELFDPILKTLINRA